MLAERAIGILTDQAALCVSHRFSFNAGSVLS
jgi:hypothetical protein